MTPLYYASMKGHVAVVQLLLLNNADVSICKEVCYSDYMVQFHIIRCCSDFLLVIKWSCVIIITPARMRSEGYSSRSVCLSLSVCLLLFSHHGLRGGL